MMRRLPTILHEHANLTDTPWFQKIADRALAPATDIAIAVSQSTADFVIHARKVPADRVKVVYLGVPLEEFSRLRSADEIAAARRELGVPPDATVVGTVTRMHDSKGNSYLVEAARHVLDERPNARFYLFGEGPLRADLEAQAARLGLGERFVFGGFAKDVARVVSAFDMSVFPSLWEGTPLTVFEALAMGKAIVATDADGLIDVLHRRSRRADRAEARRGRACRRDRAAHRPPRRARAARRGGARDGPAIRHRGVRAKDGAAVRSAAPHVPCDRTPRHPRRRPLVSRGRSAGVNPTIERAATASPMSLRPGLALALVFLCLYGGLALSIDFPRAAIGFQSDEATYYMMGYSLAKDGDLTYRREDLVRVWREFPSGPSGVFLKRGRMLSGEPDPVQGRFYYGKAFIYPLFAAPFVLMFGTNGFLVLHAMLLSVVLFCGYLFLHARAPALPSAVLAGAFVMASVVPVYFVWIMPELFNFSLAFLAFFCWLYKEVADRARSPRGTGWLFTPASDLVAAALLGIDTFSKPTNALLFAAPVAWWILRRPAGSLAATLKRTLVPAVAVFVLCAGGLFAVNMAISGEWNYQGGDRNTYYSEFPLQNPRCGAPARPDEIPRRRAGACDLQPADVRVESRAQPRVLLHRPIHGPGRVFLSRRLRDARVPRRAAPASALAVAGARGRRCVQGLIFILATPYTWHGGGVGNRYFFGGYGVMLFVLPPIASAWAAFVPWVIGGLFVAPMVLNPFVASFHPAWNAAHGPLRLLPVELTLVNDLPVNTEPDRARLWFGDTGAGDPGFLVYFLDDNAYGREADKSFWTRGRSRADFIIKTDRPIRRAAFTLTAGPIAADVRVRISGRSQQVHVEPHQTSTVIMNMPPGTPFEKEVHALVWAASVTCDTGFTPIFYDASSTDARYLGVRVRPVLDARAE